MVFYIQHWIYKSLEFSWCGTVISLKVKLEALYKFS